MKIEVPASFQKILAAIDRKGYKAYKTLQGKSFAFGPFTVKFEHVQGDPFAFPSRISVKVSLSDAGFAPSCFDTELRRLAFEDHLLRILHDGIGRIGVKIRGSGKSGVVRIQAPGQKVLKRDAVRVQGNTLTCILFAGLPAEGRTVLGKECLRLFAEGLAPLWVRSLLAASLDLSSLQRSLDTLEDYEALKEELKNHGWAAFVANGSLLPRRSGVSDCPLEKGGIVFSAPEDLSARVRLPHGGWIEGMPVPRGITLIVGGGFHGKSTLLRAIQGAVYPHVAGDGRERIATVPSAVKIRAEDGRPVHGVNVSGFMDRLPLVDSTENFSTQSASGSTSQAVNILEAIESGSEFLLMDEDTCATNFMIRDARMQALIPSSLEPITPLLDRVGEVYETLRVSTLLVMGGSGDYFDAAHHVIAMEEFRPRLVTSHARKIAHDSPVKRRREIRFPFPPVTHRRTDPNRLQFSRGKKDCVIQTQRLLALTMGTHEVDTRYLEQLVEEGQLEMCGWILRRLKTLLETGTSSNREGLERIFADIKKEGFEAATPSNHGLLALPRIQETLAVLNRLR